MTTLSTMLRERVAARRARRRGGLSLNLVSLIDILTTLVFFLLLTSAGVATNISADGVTLPSSASQQVPRVGTQIVIDADSIRVGDRQVESTHEALNDSGAHLQKLLAALHGPSGVADSNGGVARAAREQDFNIVADRSIPFALLRKVIATCADEVGLGHVSLALLPAH
jgi:biopolymer transport protein ExbD